MSVSILHSPAVDLGDVFSDSNLLEGTACIESHGQHLLIKYLVPFFILAEEGANPRNVFTKHRVLTSSMTAPDVPPTCTVLVAHTHTTHSS